LDCMIRYRSLLQNVVFNSKKMPKLIQSIVLKNETFPKVGLLCNDDGVLFGLKKYIMAQSLMSSSYFRLVGL